MCFRRFFFLSNPFILYLLYFLSWDELDFLDDDSDYDGSDSGSSGTCAFPVCFDDCVGRVSGVGHGIFIPIEVKSNCDIFSFAVFVPIGVDSKGGRLIKIFWCSNS